MLKGSAIEPGSGASRPHPQIDDIERAKTEVRKVITNGLAEFVGSERSGPISFRVPPRPDLGDDP